jgi:uncharacterized metal-binding protein
MPIRPPTEALRMPTDRTPRRRRGSRTRRSALWAGVLAAAIVSVVLLPPLLDAGPRVSAVPATRAPEVADPAPAPADPPPVGTALALLDTLEVKGRAPKTGYSREQFGQRWKDIDRNGCDSRNDILARDLRDVVRSGPCRVTGGSLTDSYTGRRIAFVRGQGTSELVQIDHVVALSDAWQKGAQRLSAADRERLANDPLNLLAVDGATNMSKGGGDAATWLPPAKEIRCAYVARQVSVKAAYRLWVTAAERAAIALVLAGCPDEPALARSDPAAGEPESAYASCAEVRAAGAAPIRRGDPGYSADLDRDQDGIACDA